MLWSCVRDLGGDGGAYFHGGRGKSNYYENRTKNFQPIAKFRAFSLD